MTPYWKNKTFCYAPFNQIYFGRDGVIKPCCAATSSFGNYNYSSIKNVYNSKSAKLTRQDFLEGNYPKNNCQSCNSFYNQTGSIHNVQMFSNENAYKAMDYSKQVMSADLADQKPIFVDLLVSNNCNFACLGCESELSSTWAKNYTDIEIQRDLDIRHTDISSEWNNNIDPIIEYILEHADTIQSIHCNGGEPFMQEQYYKLFDALIDNKIFDIHITSHTNGSISTYKGKDIVNDYLAKFTNFDITFSHDHFGKRGTYIRYPLVEEKWLKNYNRIKQVAQVQVQTSYSLFNALTIDTLEEWYIDNGIDINNWILLPWHGPTAYTPVLLSDQQIMIANQKLYKLQKNHRLSAYLSIRDDNPNLRRNFKKTIEMWDQKRNTNFVETFPELRDLI